MAIMIKDNITGKIEVIPNIQSIHSANGEVLLVKKGNNVEKFEEFEEFEKFEKENVDICEK